MIDLFQIKKKKGVKKCLYEKKLQEILKRIESLEDSEQKVITAEQGKQTLSYYIRLFSSYIGKDRSQELRSFGKKEQA